MRPIAALERKLQGWPDRSLTIALLVAAIAIATIAVTDHPAAKLAVLAWVLFP